MSLLLALSSCKSKRLVVEKPLPGKTIASNRVLNGIQEHELNFNTFNARGKSSLMLNRDSYDATLNIKIKNAQRIWISVTTIFGIEAARVLITPERLKVMNRLNGTFIDQPFRYIHQFASDEITFDNLQSIIVGNMFNQALNYSDNAEKNNIGYLLNGIINNLNFEIQTNEDFKTVSHTLRGLAGNQYITTNYSDFTTVNKQLVARTMHLNAASTTVNLEMQLKYNRITLNEVLEMPFSIPAKYKEIK
ncbi:DUF4292 domain-containing protein [Olivibacter sp. SDN3]|uniref:DUF4292 domain-containing protein n=1 Tax=Olivibacter sp. SDN3 TaxID=2764720 RepID=UPI001C9E54F6|nr:DUF4292 domain-containing protein [Olivibacter sp. SDN3]